MAKVSPDSERIMKRATALKRKRKMDEYELAEIERRITRAEAKTRLAVAGAKKADAEAEVWRARRAKLGAIIAPPSGSGVRKAGKAVGGFAKSVARGFEGLEKWARSGDSPPAKKRVVKKRVKRKTTKKRTTRGKR